LEKGRFRLTDPEQVQQFGHEPSPTEKGIQVGVRRVHSIAFVRKTGMGMIIAKRRVLRKGQDTARRTAMI